VLKKASKIKDFSKKHAVLNIILKQKHIFCDKLKQKFAFKTIVIYICNQIKYISSILSIISCLKCVLIKTLILNNRLINIYLKHFSQKQLPKNHKLIKD